MRIGSFNIMSDTAKRFLSAKTKELEKNLEDLASGTSAGSLTSSPASSQLINELTKSQDSLRIENQNIQQTQGQLQIEAGEISQNLSQLQDLRSLALQASNGTLDASARQALQQEFEASGDFISGNISSVQGATEALSAIDTQIQAETTRMSYLSAQSSSLSFRESANSVAIENMAASKSAAQDTDIAQTASDISKMKALSTVAAMAFTQSLQKASPIAEMVKKLSGG